MTDPRCDMSDLPVSMCGHCRGSVMTEAFEHVVERTMVAKYGGTCASCGDSIISGRTTIGLTSEGDWVCEGCFR